QFSERELVVAEASLSAISRGEKAQCAVTWYAGGEVVTATRGQLVARKPSRDGAVGPLEKVISIRALRDPVVTLAFQPDCHRPGFVKPNSSHRHAVNATKALEIPVGDRLDLQ